MNANLQLNIRETKEHKIVLRSYPYKFFIETTQKCNLRCIMCDPEYNSIKDCDFPPELFQKIKPYLKQAEEVNFYFFGEPTLSKNLLAYLEETKEYSFLPKIFTNGTILNEGILNTFDERGMFLNISMESATPLIYNLIRRGASFEVFESNIRKYVAKYNNRANDRFHIRLSITIAIDHISEVLNIIEFAHEMGVNDLFFGAMHGYSNRHLVCDEKKAVFYFMKAKELADKYKIRFSCPKKIGDLIIEANDNWRDFSLPVDKYLDKYLEAFSPNPLTKDCGYPWIQTAIRANGDVCSCCHKKYVMGNLYNNSFDEIWNGKKYRDLRSQFDFTYCLGEKCNLMCYSHLPLTITR